MRRLLVLTAVALVAPGCGEDGETTVTETNTETVTVTQEQTETETTQPPQTDAENEPAGGGSDCGQQGQLRIEVVRGEVSCDEAKSVTSRYDQTGEKVQEIRNWTCSSGNAMTFPVVYTCTLGDKEVVANLAGE